jgi:NADPH:quinone reductase-like Zn-dependent oxidoreductase
MDENLNEALWLRGPDGPFTIGSAPRPSPGSGEVVIRVEAVAINPADAISGLLRRIIAPRLRYPTVIGSDVAGTVSDVGDGVTAVRPGDRVLGFATGFDQGRGGAAEGAFQRFVAVPEHLCTPVPASVSIEEAAVLPLGLATAAAGLYEADQLALPFPDSAVAEHQVVLVWGASSSVGCNAVQLARASGFAVLATASPRNHDLVRFLGAEQVVDYGAGDVDEQLVRLIGTRTLAGTIAVGAGSLTHAMRIARHTRGSRRISSVYPDPVTRTRALMARARGVHVTTIWGSTPVTSPVGPAVFRDYLPAALADGRFVPAPPPEVVGVGLDAIPQAVEAMRRGVSGRKLVVRVDGGARTS